MRVGIVTVPYIKTDEHYHLAAASYDSFRSTEHDLLGIAVINHVRDRRDTILLEQYNHIIIQNDKNVLARAWNQGVVMAMEQDCEYILIPNLDVEFKPDSIDALVNFAEKNPDAGIWSMKAYTDILSFRLSEPEVGMTAIRNHEHNFSSFMVKPDTVRRLGLFDDQFEPAYYEDCDYLHRAKMAGYTPLQTSTALFYHYTCGTRKGSEEDAEYFQQYFTPNTAKYINKWGGIPNEEVYRTPYGKEEEVR